jgi:hypothetical protein
MTSSHDPWAARLSEFLDGELAGDERSACAAHVTGCVACRTELAELTRLVAAARGLPPRAPARDLWPALAAVLAPPRRVPSWPRLTLAFAAGVLVAFGAWLALARPAREGEEVARGPSYLLLLHEAEDFGAGLSAEEHAAVVERYSAWAHALGPRYLAGDELEATGLVLRREADGPTPTRGPRIGGYFLVEVAGEREALELARTCPHLEQGGWIELRRVRTH